VHKSIFSACLIVIYSFISINSCIAADADKNNILSAKANDLFWQNKFEEAKNVVAELVNNGNLAKQDKARCYVNLSICDTQLDNLPIAKKEAMQALKLAEPGSMNEADALAIQACCLILEDKTSKSFSTYQKSLAIAQKNIGEWNCDLAPLYEGLGACCVQNKNFELAKIYYTKLAQLDLLKYGPDCTHLAWSLLNLSSAVDSLGQKDQAIDLYKKVFWNFRHQNEERIIAEAKQPVDESFKQSLIQQMYGLTNAYADRNIGIDLLKKDIPENVMKAPLTRPHDFNNWFKVSIGRDKAPGLAYFDPTVPLRGLIVAVHGLGLSHHAYTPFAKRLIRDGYGIVAFDVRGFGTYRNDLLYQRADFDAIILDLTRILTALRRDYKDTPIFILGESMGGAIALRVGAISPHLVNGIISSVPSGARFHAKSTALSVAVKLLKNKHESFDIGQTIVKQATEKPELRNAWHEDPSFRMKLSASELLNFQRFMDDNLIYAAKIKTLPVIIFQGYSDQLVKPLGTLALYQAIQCKDKDLVFVGRAEHLIFEEAQFDPDIADGLISWMTKHINNSKKDLNKQ
jgi:alpha-beta hydrolase superfamily lysophospholipase/Flp pilus assembly protein TadD